MYFEIKFFVVLFASKGRKSNVKIHEDANGNIYTVGVTMKPVNSAQDVSFHSFLFHRSHE